MIKKIFKWLIPVTLVMALSTTIVSFSNSVYAEKTYSLNNYIKSEKNHHTTELSTTNEVKLNELGIFDSEIEQLSSDVLNSIEEGAEYYVNVDYYEEVLDNKVNEPSYAKMSQSSIDQTINQKYGQLSYGEIRVKQDDVTYIVNKNSKTIQKDSNKSQKSSEGILSKISDMFCDKVNAATYTDDGYTDSGKIKRTLVATHKSGASYINCSLVYTWVEAPDYALTDEMSMYVKNGTPVFSTISTKYTYWLMNMTSGYTSYQTTTPESEHNNSGVGIKFELDGTNNAVCAWEHTISLSYRANIDDQKSWTYIEVNGQYLHQQTSFSIDPTLSLGIDGSLSLSASVKSKFQTLTNAPQLFVYF